MSARRIRAGKGEVELGIRNRLAAGLRRGTKQLRQFGAGAARLGGGITAAGTAITGVLFGAAKSYAAAGDQLDKMSARTGFSAKRLSELGFAAERSGTNLETVERGAQGMARFMLNAEQGLTAATDTLNELGMSVDDFKGKSPEDQFEIFAEKISKIQDPSKKAALAMRVFGKSGVQLLPMINNGQKGLKELSAEANRLGLVLGDKDAAAAAKLTDAMGDAWGTVKGLSLQVGAAVAGEFTEFLNFMAPLLTTVRMWIADNAGLVKTIAMVAAGMVAGGTALTTFGLAVMLASTAIGAILSVVGAVLSPIGILIGLIVGATAGFLFFTDAGKQVLAWFMQNFAEVKQIVSDTIGGVFDAIKGGRLDLAAKIAFTGIRLVVGEVMESVLGIFGTSIERMSKMLAELFKQLAQFVAKLNSVRANASNALAKFIGRITGVDVQDIDSADLIGAENFQKAVDSIDTSGLAESIQGAFDPAILRAELAALKTEAAEAAASVEVTKQKAEVVKQETEATQAIAPKLAKIKESFDNFIGFSGAAASRTRPGQKSVEKQTLGELEKQTGILKEVRDGIEEMAPRFG